MSDQLVTPGAVVEAPAHGHRRGASPWTVIFMLVLMIGAGAGLTVVFLHGKASRDKATSDRAAAARAAAAEPPAVDVVRVRGVSADTTLALPGETRAFYETTVFARTSGFLKQCLVDIGDQVTDGQVLALIETPELDDQLAASTARLETLRADVRVAETAAEFARLSLARWQAAVPDGVVSQQERDQKQADRDASVARLEAAKAQVRLGESDVQRLNTLMAFKTVRAPFAGVITARHVDMGALVTAGSTTNTSPLFRVVQSSQLRVFVDVPQVAVSRVKVGMEATVSVHDRPGDAFVGKVDRTAESVDRGSRTLRVEVLVPNPDHALLPGMFVQVSFRQPRKSALLRLPAGALCLRPGPQVAVVGADKRVMFHDVTIARDLGEALEISAGLHEGDSVVLNIGSDVNTGDLVEPRWVEHNSDAPAAHGAASRPTSAPH